MKRISGLSMVLAVLLVWVGFVSVAGAAEHPRLFFNDAKVAELRQAIAVPDSHHAQAYAELKARTQKGLDAYREHVAPYKRGYMMRELAVVSRLDTDTKTRQAAADQAYQLIQDVYTDARTPVKGSGLARAMMSLSIGLTYDWCYPLWSADQRNNVKAKIDDALNQWPRFSHANLGHSRGSNWTGVCRGGELVLLVAGGEEKNRADRYERLKKELTRHMKAGYSELGVSQEGVGYTEYPAGFFLPAALACAELGDNKLVDVARTRAWWKLSMYAHSYQDHERKFIMTGVSHTSNYNEGFVSLLFPITPEDMLPYYVYHYDRHMGVKAQGSERFDGTRAGTVWALALYPTDVKAKDPNAADELFPVAVSDSRGFIFFRNRWQDAFDILAYTSGDEDHHSHAWDQPEVGAINLLAQNNRFIGGPGKGRNAPAYSTLHVDGKYNYKKATANPGKLLDKSIAADHASATVGGGKHYQTLGVNDYKRHVFLDFRFKDGAGLMSTVDTVEAGQHTYTWNANIGDDKGSDDVQVTRGTESGRPVVTLSGRDGGYAKIWLISPADGRDNGGDDPVAFETKASGGHVWVVIYTGKGTAPTAEITGEGMNSRVTVQGRTLHYDSTRSVLMSK